jgi:hypothetical protein
LRGVRAQHDSLSLQHRQLEAKFESQLGELHAMLKIKAYEADRAMVVGEENERDRRALKLELERVWMRRWACAMQLFHKNR